jgi:hypothetical protein
MDPLLLPLMRDLLEWIGKSPRTYEEVMDGWRTSCPRLPVWEECTDQRLVARCGRGVELTARGRSFLEGPPSREAKRPSAPRAARPPSERRSRAR